MWFCEVEYLLGRLWLSKRIWFFLWFALSFGHLHQVCMSQNGSTDAKTAESDCVCDACLWQFRLTKSRLYKELLLFLSFPFRPASFVAVSAHSSCGVRYYFTAWGNYKIVLKLKHVHPELTGLCFRFVDFVRFCVAFKFHFVLYNTAEVRHCLPWRELKQLFLPGWVENKWEQQLCREWIQNILSTLRTSLLFVLRKTIGCMWKMAIATSLCTCTLKTLSWAFWSSCLCFTLKPHESRWSYHKIMCFHTLGVWITRYSNHHFLFYHLKMEPRSIINCSVY